jgi:hypothetical protein
MSRVRNQAHALAAWGVIAAMVLVALFGEKGPAENNARPQPGCAKIESR